MNKLKMLFLIGLMCVPYFAYAQSKPKRDKSKDQSTLIAKQQAAAKAAQDAELKRKQALANKRRKKKEPLKNATYLTVDQATSLNLNLFASWGSKNIKVSTDGREWSIRHLPYWCKVAKYQNDFNLVYEQNPTYDERNDYFEVVSDNKVVRVNLTQPGAPINITANFNNANLEHNTVIIAKEKYLKIDANISVCGAAGLLCRVVAFITDEYGNNIKASSSYPAYGMKYTNDLYSNAHITPTTNDNKDYNVTIFIPNNSMHLVNKNNNLQCKLLFYCDKNDKYIDDVNRILCFKAKYKKGKVTTKKS